MFTGLSDYILVAVVVLVPWAFWKIINRASKDCCPECINSGVMRGR